MRPFPPLSAVSWKIISFWNYTRPGIDPSLRVSAVWELSPPQEGAEEGALIMSSAAFEYLNSPGVWEAQRLSPAHRRAGRRGHEAPWCMMGAQSIMKGWGSAEASVFHFHITHCCLTRSYGEPDWTGDIKFSCVSSRGSPRVLRFSHKGRGQQLRQTHEVLRSCFSRIVVGLIWCAEGQLQTEMQQLPYLCTVISLCVTAVNYPSPASPPSNSFIESPFLPTCPPFTPSQRQPMKRDRQFLNETYPFLKTCICPIYSLNE